MEANTGPLGHGLPIAAGAAKAARVMEVFRANHSGIDVVLLDLTLPATGGREVLAEARKIRLDIKVLTTAYGEEVAVNTVGDRHGWAFIRKPYAIACLAKLIPDVRSD